MGDYIDHTNRYSGHSPDSARIEGSSWKDTRNLLKDELLATSLSDSTLIGLEYFIEDGFYHRSDVIIAGLDDQDHKKLIVIEIKGWDAKGIKYHNSDGKQFLYYHGNEDGPKDENPLSQVLMYCNFLKEHNTYVRSGDIELIPVVLLYNCRKRDITDARIRNGLKLPDDRRISCYRHRDCPYSFTTDAAFFTDYDPVFFKEDIGELKRLISRKLNRPGEYGNDVISLLKKGQPSSNFKLCSKIGKILTHTAVDRSGKVVIGNDEPILLRGDQRTVLIKIKELIDQKVLPQNDPESLTTIYVKGGPGSGKSLIATLLMGYYLSKHGNIDEVRYGLPNSCTGEAFRSDLEEDLKHSIDSPSYSGINTEDARYKLVFIDEGQNVSRRYIDRLKGRTCSRLLVIFYDEFQTADYMKEQDIWWNSITPTYTLDSQFRCNQDEGYVSFINDILNGTDDFPFDANYLDFDVKLIKNKRVLKSLLKSNIHCVTGASFDNSKTLRLGSSLKCAKFEEPGFALSDPDELKDKLGTVNNMRGLEVPKIVVVIGDEITYDNEGIHIRNTDNRDYGKIYLVLLTRALQSCYIYCKDMNLRRYLHKQKGIGWLPEIP
ncbi:MAG: DUF2075 domain-containing protein [Clostridiales bacterium]|nr:DUF2075 domain-containing protein [Clostridiales bacterium]